VHIIGENEYERQSADTLAARYRSQRTLGEDSLARYLGAIDSSLGDRVVMVIARSIDAESEERDQEITLARLRQARAAAVQPNADMGHVMEIGRTASGNPFVVSSLGDGVLVSEQLRSGKPFAAVRALAIAVRAAEILANAHAQGIVHGCIGVHTISVGMRTILTGAVPAVVQIHAFGVAAPPLPDNREEGTQEATSGEPEAAIALAAAKREDVHRLVLAIQTMLTGSEAAGQRHAGSIPAALAPIFRRVHSPGRGFASADELREALSAASLELADPPAQPAVLPGGWEPPRRSGGGWLAFAVAALVIAIGSVYVLVRYERNTGVPSLAQISDQDTIVRDSVAGLVEPTLPIAMAAAPRRAANGSRRQSASAPNDPKVTESAGTVEATDRQAVVNANVASSRGSNPASSRAAVSQSEEQRQRRVTAPPAPPLPASASDRAGIARTIENYAHALESQRVAAVASVYPGLSAAERTRLASFFGSVDDLDVNLSLGSTTVRGDSATARVTGEYRYHDLRRLQDGRTPILFMAVLVRNNGVWGIRSIR
jgi:hypothetical protein